MSATDGTAPPFEVIDGVLPEACDPIPGPWPARIAATCICCDDEIEVFIDQRMTEESSVFLDASAVHHRLGQQAFSTFGWQLVVTQFQPGPSGTKPEPMLVWWCRACVRTSLYHKSGAAIDALRQMLNWRRIAVEERPRPPGWKR